MTEVNPAMRNVDPVILINRIKQFIIDKHGSEHWDTIKDSSPMINITYMVADIVDDHDIVILAKEYVNTTLRFWKHVFPKSK